MNEAISNVVDSNRCDWIERSYSDTLRNAGRGCFIWEESGPQGSGIFYIRSTLPSYFGSAMCAVFDGIFNRHSHEGRIVAAINMSASPAIVVIDRNTGLVIEEHLFVDTIE
jgi:hypothetical protein